MSQAVKLSEGEFRAMLREMVTTSLLRLKKNVHEVKYFHPSGKPIPNGCGFQRGGYLNECRINKNAYSMDESVHDEQYGLAKYRGGIITFSTDINAVKLHPSAFINKIKQFLETYKQRFNKDKMIHRQINRFNSEGGEHIGAYSFGNFFKGKYVGDNGELYDEKSISIEVNGISSWSLVKLAEEFAKLFKQETVMVKDLNINKIFLVDDKPSDVPLDKEMQRINTEVN